MKTIILIFSLVIFGTCLAQEEEEEEPQDPFDEARNRAYEVSTIFMTSYSDIMSSPAYSDLVTKSSDIQTSLATKNEEANQQIRTPYDEFYPTLSPGNGTEFTNECYYFTTLHLTVDVQNKFVYSYEISSVYGQRISDLQVLPSTLFSDDYYAIMNKLYDTLYDPNVTVPIIDALIVQFEIDAAKLLTRANQLLTAINNELDRLYAKFLSETEVRVRDALYSLNSIKDNHEMCLLNGI